MLVLLIMLFVYSFLILHKLYKPENIPAFKKAAVGILLIVSLAFVLFIAPKSAFTFFDCEQLFNQGQNLLPLVKELLSLGFCLLVGIFGLLIFFLGFGKSISTEIVFFVLANTGGIQYILFSSIVLFLLGPLLNEITFLLGILIYFLSFVIFFFFNKILMELKENPVLAYCLLLLLIELGFISFWFCCGAAILFWLGSKFLSKFGTQILNTIKEDAVTHTMHLEEHFLMLVPLRQLVLQLTVFTSFLLLVLNNLLLVGLLPTSLVFYLVSLLFVAKNIILCAYCCFFVAHVIILTCCNKGQIMETAQLIGTMFAISIGTFSILSGNHNIAQTINQYYNHRLEHPTLLPDDQRMSAAILAREAQIAHCLPFVDNAYDLNAVTEFVELFNQLPPKFTITDEEGNEMELLNYTLMSTMCQNFRLYNIGFDASNKRQLELYALTGNVLDKPTIRRHTGPEFAAQFHSVGLRPFCPSTMELGVEHTWITQIEALTQLKLDSGRVYNFTSETTQLQLARINSRLEFCEESLLTELLIKKHTLASDSLMNPLKKQKMQLQIDLLLQQAKTRRGGGGFFGGSD